MISFDQTKISFVSCRMFIFDTYFVIDLLRIHIFLNIFIFFFVLFLDIL